MGAKRRPFGWMTYVLMPALLALGGCGGGGPSDIDIKLALQQGLQFFMGARLAPTIEDVSNVSCQAAQGEPGYVCSYSITAVDKVTNAREASVKQGRFVQNGSKWVLMGNF